MTIDEFDTMIDNNESFLGEELDEEKMEQLNRLKNICVEIGKREKGIKYSAYPFSNRSQNAFVMLDFPRLLFCTDKKVMRLLSQALTISDDFSSTALAGELRVCFGIHNMWTKWRYDEQGQ